MTVEKDIGEIKGDIQTIKKVLEIGVVTPKVCEAHRDDLHDSIRSSGKASKWAVIIATAVGGMVGIAIGLCVYFLTRGGS